MTKFIVAIDGPAGSGKSSVSKAVARKLDFAYLDTGAAYRALTWAVQNGQISREEISQAKLASNFKYAISTDPDNYWVKAGDENVTEAIRSSDVAEGVSEFARLPEVRSFMKNLSRQIASDAEEPGIVIEGRDITTVVAPDAQIKILLTASEEVRLKRRSAEIPKHQQSGLKRQVSDRDANDLKVVDFLTPAPGVILVDSSDLNFEQTVNAVLELIRYESRQGI
jgi:cytidylate kinase